LIKTNDEYLKFKEHTKNELSEAEKHFVKHTESTVKKLNAKKKS